MENINLISSTIRRIDHDIIIELDDGTHLFIPESQQEKLNAFINHKVQFGIRPEFIYLADESDELNICNGLLTSLDEYNGVQLLKFKIAKEEVSSRVTGNKITSNYIGKRVRFNFDTFFGHIFEQETQVNITI
ncbi:hypothetical protein [Photobacterium alginatilyticum]|uniref:Uncharacterized protein n=1 Tax=Photobacterium alginatilyticum TaxID=1775171 RepID=A0ABW9YEC9_9GAMM|nr:hypothetical protein [Photobacterium alginatilyticum]NBI51790.1 hypothetical protein [Photobacterium alginatilyticum]